MRPRQPWRQAAWVAASNQKSWATVWPSRGAGRHPSVGGVHAPHRSRRRCQSGSTACAIRQRACGSQGGRHCRPVRLSDWTRCVRPHAGPHAGTPRPDRHPTAQSCNPRSVLGRHVRLVKARTGSPVARFLGSLTSNELVEVERRRVTTLFASNEGLSQRPQADLTILKQPQGRPHNVAGRAVTARCNLILDERAEMLIKAERRIPTHIHEGTNSWYRQLAPRLLMMFRRVLRSPTPPRRRKQQQTPPPDRQRWRRAAQQQRRRQEEQPPLSAVEMHERLTTVDTNTPAMKYHRRPDHYRHPAGGTVVTAQYSASSCTPSLARKQSNRAPTRHAVRVALRFRRMGLFSRMFAGRDRRANPSARPAKRVASTSSAKTAGSTKTAAAKNPVYKHAGCPTNHRTAQAASGCRNR